MAFSKTQDLSFFYSFLLINFTVKVCGFINLLTNEQMNDERVCKSRENIWKNS